MGIELQRSNVIERSLKGIITAFARSHILNMISCPSHTKETEGQQQEIDCRVKTSH
jgi:hypothetical protein